MRPVAHACESQISLETKGVTRLTKIKVDAGNYQIKFGRQSPIWEWHIHYIVGEAFAHFTPYSGNVELLFQRLDKKYSPYCEYKYPLQSCPNCIDVLTWIAGTKHCSAISALTTRNLPSICHTEMCCVPSRSEASDCKVARFAVPLVPGTVGVCSASSAWHCWRDWITAATLLTTDQPTWWCRPPIGQISSSALEKSKKQNLSMKFYTKASLGLLPWWFIFLLSPP